MASAAVISLIQTIHRLRSPPGHVSIAFANLSDRDTIKHALDEFMSLKRVLMLFDDTICMDTVFPTVTDANALEAFESHLSTRFPSEYRIIRFAHKMLSPLQEFLHNINITGQRLGVLKSELIREAVDRFEHVVGDVSLCFKRSLVFTINMEADISSFIKSVMKLKEYVDRDVVLKDGVVPYEFRNLVALLADFHRDVDKLLEVVLRKLNRSKSRSQKLNALDEQIREAACKLEDTLEAHLSNQFILQSDQTQPLSFSLYLHELNQDIISGIRSLKKLKDEYTNELFNPLPDEDDDRVITPGIDFDGMRTKMVGHSDEFLQITDQLKSRSSEPGTLSMYGMAGIGKTTLARRVFEDESVLSWFDGRAWVDVGPKYLLKGILLCILAQVNPSLDKMLIEGDEKLVEYLPGSLKGKRYLIVLDDVWDKQLVDDLERLLPNNDNGGRVLLITSRLGRVSDWNNHSMRFLNKEESWDLLRGKVFCGEPCTPKLEKVGKKIAEDCEGLPLMIVTVAHLLAKAERTEEYWYKVAAGNQNPVFMDAYNHIMKVLLPSYNYLPQHLKSCFLYMGVFPRKHEITRSELIKLWSAEGFLDRRVTLTNLDKKVDSLVNNSLVIFHQKSSTSSVKTSGVHSSVKTCSLHSSFWHLCRNEARKNKFSRIITSYADGLAVGIKSERRLCVHNNILFGIRDVHKSIASVSTTRSLLCAGAPHPYPVPICFGLKLLRVLDALSIRFYEFPTEVLKLVQLKHFSLGYNGKLPASISILWNLQFLIVRRHLCINYNGSETHLPMEIWDMKELKHLQIMESDIPCPPNDGALLPNLVALLDVSPHSCTKGVLEKLHNLEKLGILIVLAHDAAEPLSCFDHISNLSKLKSLKCVVMNPELAVPPPPPLSVFPSSLRKLTLSGLGYPWEDMRKISSLRSLEVLKLRCYAFRGPTLDTDHNTRFTALKFLLIEDSDLEQWTVGPRSMLWLRHVILKHCYKLEAMPMGFRDSLHELEVVECSWKATAFAKEMKEYQSERGTMYHDAFVGNPMDERDLYS